MRIHRIFIVISLLSLISGCYFGITGKVIDAETNQPIEGAVVLVEWTKTKGYGLTYTESYKVAETFSDKEGKFVLPGCYSPFVNEPDLTIYKKGYVAWNNKMIFPKNEKRNDFQWRNGYPFSMERFNHKYSYADHYSFIIGAGHTESASDKKTLFKQKINEWERIKAINEKDVERR